MNDFKVIVFKVGKEYYGIDITTVQGIENVEGYTKVPNTANYIKGIINLRGDVIPVYSLREKFNLADEDRQELQLIIAKVGDIRIGFEIDEIDAIQDVTEDMVHAVPTVVRTPEKQYYDKVINAGGKIVVVIKAENMLSDAELASVNELVG